MATINVNKYLNCELTCNDWEYEYIMDALYYYQYYEKPTDFKLKKFMKDIDLDEDTSKNAFKNALKDYSRNWKDQHES